MELKFRDLTADEVDVRVGRIGENYMTLLLYKDARCDMNILDETVGAMNWQRRHLRDNANCVVSLWDCDKEEWVSKEDTGVESNTEKEKGLASDSFKRACTNWGIGRELYTTPDIFIFQKRYDGTDNYTVQEKNGKYALKSENKLAVEVLTIKDKKITELVVSNTIKGVKNVIFEYPKAVSAQPKTPAEAKNDTVNNNTATGYKCTICGNPVDEITAFKSLKKYGVVLDRKECAELYKEYSHIENNVGRKERKDNAK